MINETIVRVRYAETDQMGVVYHSNYIVWFEIGRTEFFRNIGLEYTELEYNNILVPVVDVRCTYKSSAKYDDEIIIKTKVTKLTPARIQFDYEIVRKFDKEVLANGYTVHAFASKDLKIINMKKNYKEVFDIIYDIIEK
ncbi:thioesterase superfamily protein [Gottschalkia acidurici 9a]|uniref:Thioesterase superfamily protein n=1 Tax=Gottschalkia acidurici (strain ATCC 7906 / DSM 604 / BCRC 14475 / CIP 104303 / KCTC 5404 / NCIMB 10678 / 9a) TaxID=1128398 RepID=K0AYZ2_GOTA9|nr:thioesterase family protein [Gottschalkia acidurici]AFS79023.1 thioesterase superfamily protein [Gottschalkia acidurici 9a]